MEISMEICDEGKRLTVGSYDKDSLFLIAAFPASEAIGNHGPRFGKHPDDVELIIATIKDGTSPKFKQLPRFGLPILGNAGPSTRFGPPREASKRATRKINGFVSWLISSGRITGKLAQSLVAALELKNNMVVRVKRRDLDSAPHLLAEMRNKISIMWGCIQDKNFTEAEFCASVIEQNGNKLGLGEIAGMGSSLSKAANEKDKREINHLLKELSNRMGFLVVTLE